MKMRLMIDAQSFEVEVGDLNERPILVSVDGEAFEVWPDEKGNGTAKSAQPLQSVPISPVTQAATGMAPGGADKIKAVLAPIPGVILSVTVKEGDAVVFGQELCVLEAMKMKNSIRANRSGKVARICVQAGDQVKHSQMLLEYTD